MNVAILTCAFSNLYVLPTYLTTSVPVTSVINYPYARKVVCLLGYTYLPTDTLFDDEVVLPAREVRSCRK